MGSMLHDKVPDGRMPDDQTAEQVKCVYTLIYIRSHTYLSSFRSSDSDRTGIFNYETNRQIHSTLEVQLDSHLIASQELAVVPNQVDT